VLRFWESEISGDPIAVLGELLGALDGNEE
jgi:hypothetical protein